MECRLLLTPWYAKMREEPDSSLLVQVLMVRETGRYNVCSSSTHITYSSKFTTMLQKAWIVIRPPLGLPSYVLDD
ncbi:hypothetical protein JTE90_009336 [Oedothorax gibbosus]|uniref:Uncharacterized protein n=1 Tax=Oedothorax gibbosus TaxID=931172 RepID=A0AAV6VUI5_9ARAC|nr:hypothetical protein JTE90_009336 [Oedothorax gibbosus]